MDKQKFHIGVILTITHGNLLTEINNIYDILNFMLDENLFTHQLLSQHPQLEQWNSYAPLVNSDNWDIYLQKAVELFGDKLEISKVPLGVWTHIDPTEELNSSR